MNPFKKIFGSKPAASRPDDLVTAIVQEVAAQLEQERKGFDFGAHHAGLRQLRRDAGIRRELAVARAFAHRTRPRMPQVAAKVVEKILGARGKVTLVLETGQRLVGFGQRNVTVRNRAIRAAYPKIAKG